MSTATVTAAVTAAVTATADLAAAAPDAACGAACGAAAGVAGAAGVAATVEVQCPQGWLAVCTPGDLTPGRGVAALLPDGTQVALFIDRGGRMYAIGNRDPFTGAQVLSRGLTGSAAGRPFVASPLLKQRFDLATGDCLDDPSVTVPTYRVRAAG
ncbi:nitrite reductase (NAD(P)H) small subunit [Streptomyces inhibens]|uniref:Nitrite reductase (NAD(P)H) small subunit n=1 Tax=Streptomyces inhibens TaxID=2293571 RepID=A0A371PTX5_STRIH|nr:nitrite reductase small subunit NirD [Streptomyces inhibens]REK85889.1 nitrite reductase (NAD(P)H) small subunit [Streptomyces inhibens]